MAKSKAIRIEKYHTSPQLNFNANQMVHANSKRPCVGPNSSLLCALRQGWMVDGEYNLSLRIIFELLLIDRQLQKNYAYFSIH